MAGSSQQRLLISATAVLPASLRVARPVQRSSPACRGKCQVVARSDTPDDGGSFLFKKTSLTDPGPLRGRRATSPASGRGILRLLSYQRRQAPTGSTPCSNLAPIGAPQPAAVPSCTRLVALEGSPGLRPCERRERMERERVRLVGQTPAGRGQGARPRGSRGILDRSREDARSVPCPPQA